ncbi:MAG: TIM barrel protein, partial [Bryobacterales bacterium]|nr:TIM barrel protein [Bryobacterales bacterium]
RIRLAAEQGFDAVEFWNWDNKDLPAIRKTAAEAGIAIATFQSNRGGTLINPAQRETFIAGIRESLAKAQEMRVPQLFLLTDELGEDRSVRFRFPEIPPESQRESALEGLKELARVAEAASVSLLLEPLNTYVDHPGYFLNHSALGLELVRAVGSPRIKLLYDIYHMQVMEGNLIPTLTRNLDAIGHIHVADSPGRRQPGTGEINYPVVLRQLRESGYSGYIGLEFEPTIPSKEAAAQALALIKG